MTTGILPNLGGHHYRVMEWIALTGLVLSVAGIFFTKLFNPDTP